MKRRWSLVAVLVAAGVAVGGWFAARSAAAKRARRQDECRALAAALDKTLREHSPRYFEGIVEHRYDPAQKRCLAAIEHHYKSCDAKQAKKAPLPCAGPDADIAIYSFQDDAARPLYICERIYKTATARCTESTYGADGGLLATRDIPPERFPPIKTALIEPTP